MYFAMLRLSALKSLIVPSTATTTPTAHQVGITATQNIVNNCPMIILLDGRGRDHDVQDISVMSR